MNFTQRDLERYLHSIGKDASELSAVRKKQMPNRDAMEVELDFTNTWGVTYTRVLRAWESGNGIKYKSVTSMTRLHVPIREVPDMSIVYTKDGHGPYRVIHVDGAALLIPENSITIEGKALVEMSLDQYVSIECYYMRDVGVIAGTQILATENDIRGWADKNMASVDGNKLHSLVSGCKFEMWAAAMAASGSTSVFDLPRRE